MSKGYINILSSYLFLNKLFILVCFWGFVSGIVWFISIVGVRFIWKFLFLECFIYVFISSMYVIIVGSK